MMVIIALCVTVILLYPSLEVEIYDLFQILTWSIMTLAIGMAVANTSLFRRLRERKGSWQDTGFAIVILTFWSFMYMVLIRQSPDEMSCLIVIYMIPPLVASRYMGLQYAVVVSVLMVIIDYLMGVRDLIDEIAIMAAVASLLPWSVNRVTSGENPYAESVFTGLAALLAFLFLLLFSDDVTTESLDTQATMTLIVFLLTVTIFPGALDWSDRMYRERVAMFAKQEQIDMAQRIQLSSVPQDLPHSDRVEIACSISPAQEVGGDFYDVFSPKEGLIAVVVADVSGKGLPAALFMMRSMATIRTVCYGSSSPGNVLTIANRELNKDNSTEQFVTVWLGIIDTFTGTLWYSSAGHPAPLFRRGGRTERMEVDRRLMLGSMDGIKYPTRSIKIEPGDTVFAFTDGVTEQFNESEEQFGLDAVMSIVDSHEGPMEELNGRVKDAIREFAGNRGSDDDITMASFRFGDLGLRKFSVVPVLDSLPDVTGFVASEGESMGMSPVRVSKTEIVCEELFVNICKYSRATDVEVYVRDDGERMMVTFSDDGVRFNPLTHRRPDEDYDVDSIPIGDLGIHMTVRLSDDTSYLHIGDRNIFTFWMSKE